MNRKTGVSRCCKANIERQEDGAYFCIECGGILEIPMPNQNNNEWWKKRFRIEPDGIDELSLDCMELDDAINSDKPTLSFLREEIDAFLASQISQAEQRGKREGLEEARKIFMTRFQECVDDRVRLNKIDQAIDNLK